MKWVRSSVVGLAALSIALPACQADPLQQEVLPHPSSSAKVVERCTPGKPLKVEGAVEPIPSRCPRSTPREVGYSEKIDLGSVLADQPCKELPDFAGNWWRPVPPYPIHLKQAGHETIGGTMTLVDEDTAEFDAPRFKMVMRHRTMLIPPKGRFELRFTRIEGPFNFAGGCD